MTNKEKTNRNIGLTFDFVKFLIDNPEKVENLPNDFELEFIEKDFKIDMELKGKRKKLVKVKNSFEMIGWKTIGYPQHRIKIIAEIVENMSIIVRNNISRNLKN